MNNAPEDRHGDEAPAHGPDDGPCSEEQDLRQLFQGAVGDLQPSAGALDHLRVAVPARRARKRQLLIGAVATAVLTATAVPAFVTVANSGGDSSTNTVNTGHGEVSDGGRGEGPGATGGDHGPGGPTDGDRPGRDTDPSRSPVDPSEASSGDGDTDDSASPSNEPAAQARACAAGQLDVTTARADRPDSDGRVYGTFRVANVSATDCEVNGRGSVDFQARGAADKAKIKVVDHTAGDQVPGLPDPSEEKPALLLKPDSAYEVRFAWVPNETCAPTGPSPTPTPSDGGASGGNGGGAGTPPGEPPVSTFESAGSDGSVAVTHTAQPGAPTAETTIPNACAGTIYRTGVLGG
ncbi:hypothetical protein [Streptomyces sp. NPDC048057]|uniref:hypothetical protein n=1 Tax=Streptomyces sp. NPDC048057 TaxID=3155628 RepID=UPI0033F60B90